MKDFFKNKCDIVKDLLPLYADNSCSKETADEIKVHLVTCDSCRKYLSEIKADMQKEDETVSVPDSDPHFERVMNRLRRRKIIRRSVVAAAIIVSVSINTVLLLTND